MGLWKKYGGDKIFIIYACEKLHPSLYIESKFFISSY